MAGDLLPAKEREDDRRPRGPAEEQHRGDRVDADERPVPPDDAVPAERLHGVEDAGDEEHDRKKDEEDAHARSAVSMPARRTAPRGNPSRARGRGTSATGGATRKT